MSLEVGNKVEGKITGLAKFGAFIDLGGNKTGLVHISEVSDKFVEDINDELNVGDVVTVEVLSIDDGGKIALSMRDREKEAEQKKEQPKKNYKENYNNNERKSSNSTKRTFKKQSKNTDQDFDSLMNDFLKESETRLSSLKKNTENKRGGRGGRRS